MVRIYICTALNSGAQRAMNELERRLDGETLLRVRGMPRPGITEPWLAIAKRVVPQLSSVPELRYCGKLYAQRIFGNPEGAEYLGRYEDERQKRERLYWESYWAAVDFRTFRDR